MPNKSNQIANTCFSPFKKVICFIWRNTTSGFPTVLNQLFLGQQPNLLPSRHGNPFISLANILLTDTLIKTNVHELSNERLM